MAAVKTMTRYTSECYDCGYVSAAYMNTSEADEDGRMHRCPVKLVGEPVCGYCGRRQIVTHWKGDGRGGSQHIQQPPLISRDSGNAHR